MLHKRKAPWLILLAGVLLAGVLLGVGQTRVGLLGDRLASYSDYGKAEQASRLSELMILRSYLVSYARSNGAYPDTLADAVPQRFLDQIRVSTIVYVAAGKRYPLVNNKLLFHENTANRYADEVGWFEFEEDDWSFHSGEMVPVPSPAKPAVGGG